MGLPRATRSYGDETISVARKQFDPGFPLGKPREEVIYFDTDPSWEREVAEFIEAITNGTPIETGDSAQALAAMKMVFAIYSEDVIQG